MGSIVMNNKASNISNIKETSTRDDSSVITSPEEALEFIKTSLLDYICDEASCENCRLSVRGCKRKEALECLKNYLQKGCNIEHKHN